MISVIVPVYNSECYLENCLNSIMNQTYKDLEVICVDDGSTDSSLKILTEYQKKDNRFKILSQKNSGVSVARNLGLENASGKYITFVDSDDDIDLHMYEILIDLMEQYHADIVHCGYKKIELSGLEKDIQGTECLLIQNSIESNECLITGKYFVGGTVMKVYKKDIISTIRFNEELKINEDVLFNFEAFRKSERNVFYDLPLYHYYERKSSSCSRTDYLKKSLDCLFVANKMYDECIGSKLEQCTINKLFLNLTSTYRCYVFNNSINKKECMKEINKRIIEILPKCKGIPKKYLYNYYFMRVFPFIYKYLYRLYNHIRKPNWDI